MPVSPTHPEQPTGTTTPKIVRQSARRCPICWKPSCLEPAACKSAFGTAEWLECPACAGSGYDTTGFQLYCIDCGGAKVLEVEVINPPEVAD
jgi:hypothetical protein